MGNNKKNKHKETIFFLKIDVFMKAIALICFITILPRIHVHILVAIVSFLTSITYLYIISQYVSHTVCVLQKYHSLKYFECVKFITIFQLSAAQKK